MGGGDGDIPAGEVSAEDGAGIIDFAAQRLSADMPLGEARLALAASGDWGMALVDGDGQYVGMLTLRSIVALSLRTALEDAGGHDAAPGAAGRVRPDLGSAWPARQVIDLEVPVVRLSTQLPQLLSALCRRAPVVPIVSDTGMKLLGVASLQRAARVLYGP